MNDKKQEKNTLLNLIDEARKKKGLKITELDKLAGIPDGKSSQLISGKYRKDAGRKTPLESFSIENMYKVLVALDLLKTEEDLESSQICRTECPFKHCIEENSEMESKSQDKKTLLELIALITKKMGMLGIKQQNELAIKSQTSPSVINRLLKEERSIAAHNLFMILKALDLLKTEEDLFKHCIEENSDTLELLKMTQKVLASGTNYAFSLSENIKSFYEAVIMKQQLVDHEQRLKKIEEKDQTETEKVRIRKEDPTVEKKHIIKRRAM